MLAERCETVDGVRMRYLTGGEGPPLILCHGFMGSAENFEAWFDQLTSRRTLIVPDLPGCGATPPLATAHTAAALARSVYALAETLRLTTFDLGGLCLGASVACALLRLCPKRIDRMVLHTPLLAPSLVNRRFRMQARVMTAPGLFPAVHWLASRRRVSDLYKRLVVEGDDADPSAAEMNFRNQIRADPRALREWLRDGLARDDIGVVTARLHRTLLLIASEDRIANVDALRALVGGRCGAALAVVEDTGHGWNRDTVHRQLAVICAFLDRPDSAPEAAG